MTVVLDNTFASMVLSPASLGVDVIVHRLSKFIGGIGDIKGESSPKYLYNYGLHITGFKSNL